MKLSKSCTVVMKGEFMDKLLFVTFCSVNMRVSTVMLEITGL